MDLKLLFDEFAASIVRERTLQTDERLSSWSNAVKSRLVRLGKRRGYSTFATDDRRKSAAYLWDVAWCVEESVKRGQPPTGAGIDGLKFPVGSYRKLVLTAEVEWGRQGHMGSANLPGALRCRPPAGCGGARRGRECTNGDRVNFVILNSFSR